jgi:hypothetical protein
VIKTLPARLLKKDKVDGMLLETYDKDRRNTYYVRKTSRIFWNLLEVNELEYVQIYVTDDVYQDLISLKT